MSSFSNYNITRIAEDELDTVNLKQFHKIGAISRKQEVEGVGEDPRSGTYVEVKPDRRLVPFVSQSHPGTDMTPHILLVEVSDPDDPAVLDRLKAAVGEKNGKA